MANLSFLTNFADQIEILQSAFRQKYTDEQLERLFVSLKGVTDDIFKKAIDWLILNKTRLPSLHEISMSVSEEVNREWQDEKNREKEQAGKFFNKTPLTDMGKEAFEFINSTLRGDMTIEQLNDEMISMDNKYPGVGWNFEARKMMKNYRRERVDNEK